MNLYNTSNGAQTRKIVVNTSVDRTFVKNAHDESFWHKNKKMTKIFDGEMLQRNICSAFCWKEFHCQRGYRFAIHGIDYWKIWDKMTFKRETFKIVAGKNENSLLES